MKKILFFVFAYVFMMAYNASGQAYVKTFTTVRTLVAVDSTDLTNKLANAQSGDDIVLKDGVTYTGSFNVTHSDVRILCNSHEHCVINGIVTLSGNNTWLQGVELYYTAGANIVQVLGTSTRVINNHIYSDGVSENNVGIFTANTNDNIEYGNIIVGVEHGIYPQNSQTNGVEYIVGNYFGKVLANGNGRLLHAYTQSPNKLEAFNIEKNIFRDGEVLVGGEGSATPSKFINVTDNLFYNATPRIGYNRPAQVKFNNNTVLKARVILDGLWGAGETVYLPYPDVNEFKYNTLFFGNFAEQLYIVTQRYNPTRQVGVARLKTDDLFDYNLYIGSSMIGRIIADNVNAVGGTLAEWRNVTLAHGNQYDVHSTATSGVPANGYKFTQNEYDPDLGTLSVYSFSGTQSLSVALDREADLYNIEQPYGAVVASGTQISAPIVGEFSTYLVRYKKKCEMRKQDIDLIKQKLNEINLLLETCQ